MSNDPNRLVNQQRQLHEQQGHHTLETVKLEKEKASVTLPRYQLIIVIGLAIIGVAAVIALILAALGVF